MVVCLCCHHLLLRCVRHRDVYWFCPNCWQEMPNIEISAAGNPLKAYSEDSIHSNERLPSSKGTALH